MGVVAVLLAICVAITIAVSRTLGRRIARRNRRTAVWCCGLTVPLLLCIGAVIDAVVISTGPPAMTLTDSPPLGVVLMILAALAMPFTVVSSEFATPTTSTPRKR